MPGSGKTETMKFIKQLNIPTISMGDAILDEMRKRGIETTHKNIGDFATKIRKEMGMDAAASLCIPYVKTINSNIIFIDGIRSYEETELFKKTFTDNFVLLTIHAPQKLRYERIMKRDQARDTKTWEDFILRDERELSWGLGKSIALADHVIVNDNTLENLHNQIKDITDSINLSP